MKRPHKIRHNADLLILNAKHNQLVLRRVAAASSLWDKAPGVAHQIRGLMKGKKMIR